MGLTDAFSKKATRIVDVEAEANQKTDQNAAPNSGDFEEAYFMDPTNGSAYHANNYLETALLSRLYYEMAENIAKCFRPKRVLEVGCAAGPTVYYLNSFFSVEAHGIDVSQWAVDHRFHKHVTQGSADSLNFEDGSFDLVFSCHALEHLSESTIDRAITEMTRVCSADGVQLHLLPILKSGPYTDTFGSIVGLKKDKTHNLLFERAWWIDRWARQGWIDTGMKVGHTYDNHGFEMSDCQLILSKTELEATVIKNIAIKNLDVARSFLGALTRRPGPGLESFLNEIRDHWK